MNPSAHLRAMNYVWHGKLEDFITGLVWSPSGDRLAAASVSGQVAIYDSVAGQATNVFENAHSDGCDAIAWRPDGKALATAGRDGQWKLWDAMDGKTLVVREAGAMWAEHVAWSVKPIGDHGHLLAVGAGNKVSMWNDRGEAWGEPLKLAKTIADVAWIMGGSTLALATSTEIVVRDPADADERVFQSRDPILSMAFSPSGKWLMTGNQDCSVHVWNTDSGSEMHMRGFAAKVRQLAWHRGSRWLATGGGESIAVWDCSGKGPEGRTPLVLEWHPDFITALHYQPQGDWLASGARDGSIGVWSPTQRQNQIGRAKIMNGVTRVAWSPDGQLLAAAGDAGEVQVLAID